MEISTADTSARGPQQIAGSLAVVAKKRQSDGSLTQGKKISSVVHFIRSTEVNPPGTATKIQSGPATVLMRGEQFPAAIATQAEFSPGDVSKVDIVFNEPAAFAEVQRFALMNDEGHIIALGVVTSIEE